MKNKIESLNNIEINRQFINDVNKEQFNHDKQLAIDGQLLQKTQAKLKQKEFEAEDKFDKNTNIWNQAYKDFEKYALENDTSEEIQKTKTFYIAFKTNETFPKLVEDSKILENFDFVSKLKLKLKIDENGNPLEKIDFSYFIKEYELFKFKRNTKYDNKVINKDWTIEENNVPDEILNLKKEYLNLSLEDKIIQTEAVVIQKYLGELEKPEIVEYNNYEEKDIQYIGIKHYPALANIYTRDIVMVNPEFNPYEDFKNDFQLIKMSSGNKRKFNKIKTIDDIRNRKDAKFFDLSIDYKDQNADYNTKMFNFIDTDDATDYQLRHIYFNEKYFLMENEKDDKLDNYLDILLSQKLSKNTFDYIFRMFIKSIPHKQYLFGEKYFGIKLQNFFNNQWINYNSSIKDINIISKADKISPISYIMWNDGEESPKIERFKKRNQLITQQINGGYLREIIFESTVSINEIQKYIGEPTVYFEFNGIYHYSYSLKENYITLNMFDKVYETLKEFLHKTLTIDQFNSTKFNQSEMFFNNFEKKYYVNYNTTDNKINLNKLRKI